MFKSKRHSSNNTVSPLQPPAPAPASTSPYPPWDPRSQEEAFQSDFRSPEEDYNPTQSGSGSGSGRVPVQPSYFDKRDRRRSQPLSGIPQHMYDQDGPYPNGGGGGAGAGAGSMRGRPMSAGAGLGGPGGGPGNTLGVPTAGELQRTSTGGTSGSDAGSKKEKRRSGFFGFGKKDKDKDKDKESSKRSSFSVDRPNQVPSKDPTFSRHTLSSMPPQNLRAGQDGRFPPVGGPNGFPGPGAPGPGAPGHAPGERRNVSNPNASPSGDFGPSDSARYPKSQSMAAFGGGRGDRRQGDSGMPMPMPVPAAGRPDQPPRGDGMSKSQSMPFNQYQQRDDRPRRSSQDMIGTGQSPQRGYGGIPGSGPGPVPDGVPPPIDKTPKGSPRIAQTQSSPPTPRQGDATGKMHHFDGVVELISAQPQKTYVASPPELEMILARTSAGGQPKQGQPGSATNDWDQVWLQLSGISLSMWSMKETRAAAARGEKVPPTYFNITDSSLELLAPLPPPPHRPTSHAHHFVFSLNTAGSNRLLFSCPSERDMAKWATGLRLAAWERARLEEIYTGHLIKSDNTSEPPSELVRGRMEGWVRARVMGGTDWKRLWVVLSTPDVKDEKEEKKNRRRSLFGIGDNKDKDVVQEPNTGQRMASFYLEPRTPKNQTSNTAVLTITNVTQAYAVFPERLEVMSQSNLMKVVGRVNGELVTIEGRLRESGWALIMPETPESPQAHTNGTGTPSPLNNMMRWVTGFHDVFGLYGRPEKYNWDPTDPKSLFFAYPQGENRNRLFLDIDEALRSDFRTSNLAAIRTSFATILQQRLKGPHDAYRPESESEGESPAVPTPRADNSYRLPPLSFGETGTAPVHDKTPPEPRSLTPITERTDIASRNPSTKTDKSTFLMNEGGSGQRQVVKQTSGSSNKHPSSLGDERLATISDSNENGSGSGSGPLTDEPTPLAGPTRTNTGQSVSEVTPITHESAATTWSQSTGQSPSRGVDSPARPGSGTEEFSTPQQEGTSTLPSSSERDLPDLPGSYNPQRPSDTSGPTLGAALSSPTKDRDAAVLSPTPRRGSVDPNAKPSGYEQAAAAYLANVVEKRGGDESEISPPPGHTPLDMGTQRVSEDKPRPTIVTQLDGSERRPANAELGRKPSGARPKPVKSDSMSSTRALASTAEVPEGHLQPEPVPPGATAPLDLARTDRLASAGSFPDLGEDAANFVAYADQPSPAKPLPASSATQKPVAPKSPEQEIRSSFAPSKAATERKARADQAAADAERAKTMPGAGKRTDKTGHTWSDESDEDEGEDEEDEGGKTGDKGKGRETHGPPMLPPLSHQSQGFDHTQEKPSVQRLPSQTRALPAIPRPGANGDARGSGSVPTSANRDTFASSGNGGRGPAPTDRNATRSRSPAAPLPQPPHVYSQAVSQAQASGAAPPAARQTIWNANFSADHGLDPSANKSGKFVDIDEPSTLTKAFAPHGLLQAGLQDKEGRSAKKQEEMARETGESLVHVPEKPPPPQMGLLGAVAQHEEERKNPGGIGATLTDRERERRLAEDRQREQRPHMDSMRSYGSGDGGNMGMYGGSQQYSPYGMNMGMMGMPPMGYNPYQSGFNPYAQQQAMMAAQMAYQQAMMSYGGPYHGGGGGGHSQAGGSQAGDHQPMHPNTTGDQRPDSPSSITHQPHSQSHSPVPHFQPFYGGYGWPGMPPMSPMGQMPQMHMGGMGGMGGMPPMGSPSMNFPPQGQGQWGGSSPPLGARGGGMPWMSGGVGNGSGFFQGPGQGQGQSQGFGPGMNHSPEVLPRDTRSPHSQTDSEGRGRVQSMVSEGGGQSSHGPTN